MGPLRDRLPTVDLELVWDPRRLSPSLTALIDTASALTEDGSPDL